MTPDVKRGLQRTNDELTYPVILKIVFKRNKFEKHEKCAKEKSRFFFLRSARELSDFCHSE